MAKETFLSDRAIKNGRQSQHGEHGIDLQRAYQSSFLMVGSLVRTTRTMHPGL
jgi:hypothetical protein